MLAAASKYFEELFVTLDQNHPVIVLKDVKVKYLILILEYVYTGQVDLTTDDIKEFNRVADSLQIKVELKVPEKSRQSSKLDQSTKSRLSDDSADISSSKTGETSDEDETMDPSYDDIMEDTSLAPFAISSVRSIPKTKEPSLKKAKLSQEAEKEMPH